MVLVWTQKRRGWGNRDARGGGCVISPDFWYNDGDFRENEYYFFDTKPLL